MDVVTRAPITRVGVDLAALIEYHYTHPCSDDPDDLEEITSTICLQPRIYAAYGDLFEFHDRLGRRGIETDERLCVTRAPHYCNDFASVAGARLEGAQGGLFFSSPEYCIV